MVGCILLENLIFKLIPGKLDLGIRDKEANHYLNCKFIESFLTLNAVYQDNKTADGDDTADIIVRLCQELPPTNK